MKARRAVALHRRRILALALGHASPATENRGRTVSGRQGAGVRSGRRQIPLRMRPDMASPFVARPVLFPDPSRQVNLMQSGRGPSMPAIGTVPLPARRTNLGRGECTCVSPGAGRVSAVAWQFNPMQSGAGSLTATARNRHASACCEPLRRGVAVRPGSRVHSVELRANAVKLRVRFNADRPCGTGWSVWPAIASKPPVLHSQLSSEVDTEFHGVGTEFHRARHGRFRPEFAGVGSARSFVSLTHLGHSVVLRTINWPLTTTSAHVAAIFSHCGAAPGRRLTLW